MHFSLIDISISDTHELYKRSAFDVILGPLSAMHYHVVTNWTRDVLAHTIVQLQFELSLLNTWTAPMQLGDVMKEVGLL